MLIFIAWQPIGTGRLLTALNQTGQEHQTAARNAIDGASLIRQALQNPEIKMVYYLFAYGHARAPL